MRVASYALAAQAQPAPPPPQQPPPPAMADVPPSGPVENDMNTERRRSDELPQSGQLASSSIRLIVRSRSNVFLHMVQVYSYRGILPVAPL